MKYKNILHKDKRQNKKGKLGKKPQYQSLPMNDKGKKCSLKKINIMFEAQ